MNSEKHKEARVELMKPIFYRRLPPLQAACGWHFEPEIH
jgi:hypothetical protein